MSYEREAVAENTSAIPTAAQPIFKEERVISPYKPQPKIGQNIINNGTEKPEEPKAPVESVTLSPAAAALARKEQKFRQQQEVLKTKEEALEKERAEIAQLKEIKAKLEKKDYSGLEKLVPYDEYTNFLIEKGAQSTPEQQELKKLHGEIESIKKAQQEDISKRFDAAVADRRKAVNELVESNPAFVRIKKAKQQEAVVQHILDTWEHDNIDLPIEQAAKEVDEILTERAKKWAELIKEEQTEQSQSDEKKQLPPLKPGLKTLTNNMIATGDVKRAVKSFQGMTDQERWAEARRRAEEKLKKE